VSPHSPYDLRKVRRSDDLADAIAALATGLVVGIPTDTVYGLAVRPTVPGATSRLFEVKRRPRDLRLPVLVAGVDQLEGLADSVPTAAARLMECFWPGALTVVVDLAPGLDLDLGEDAVGRAGTVGVRCPDHPVVQALCRAAGPLAVTSANVHGAPECHTAQEVAATFGDTVAVVVDGGRCDGTPSTVVDGTGASPLVLRAGPVTEAEIKVCLGSGLPRL
jgi:L-threonylcarbamoyladenylate synthase